MTLAGLAAGARAAARSRWALPALLVVVALWLAWRLDAGRESEAAARRLAEEARLRAEGLLVVERAKGRTLEAEARRLAGANADLAGELARARRAAPGARVVGTASASTGPRPAAGPPRVYPLAALQGEARSPAPPAGACLLAEGDQGEVHVSEVVLETREGAQLLVGAAEAWRVGAAPARLFGGPFQAHLSTAKAPAPPPPTTWGAGLYAGVSREGWAVGPLVAAPPARLGAWEVSGVGGAGVGPSGAWQGFLGGLVRF